MSDSFIDLYLKTTENSKPAREYHIWSMLSALSVFAGRRFWFPFGPYHYYTNLYAVLVGEPGNGKSSAMNRAKNIVRGVGCAPVAASQASKESMSLEMSNEKFPGRKFFTRNGQPTEYNQYAIFATELTQFIAINPLGMLDFLTTVWDEPVYEVKTKNKGNDYVVGPYITMCACMTPELVKGFLKQNLLTGGFARRSAFVLANYSNIVPIPTYTPEQQAAEQACIQFGKKLQSKSGEFTWTDDLKEFYIAWNAENENLKRERPPTTRGWFESKAEMLFKLSMLISLANECGDNLVLDIPHYKLALYYCSLVEKNLERVFEGSGINPSAQAAAQICRMLEAYDLPMNKKHLEMMFFDQVPNLRELQDTLVHLVNCGRLAERSITIEAKFLGTLIGTPNSLANRTDLELAVYLKRRELPPDVSEAGPSLT